METTDIINKLWEDYSSHNPSVKKIHELFSSEGEKIQNDHIAFRTFNDERVNINVLSKTFIKANFVEKDTYYFSEKKLNAKHFEHTTDTKAPKIFISELILEEFSPFMQKTIHSIIDKIPSRMLKSEDIIFMGNMWEIPSFETYEKLKNESEYAAWLYVYGFRANHFTVLTNSLKKYNRLEDLNSFLKNNGFLLNNSGGEIKGNPEELLEQSSTMADIVKIKFKEGSYEIPSCYYEFARRYINSNGKLYSGFIAKSADKIFESTNYYIKKT